MARIRQFKPAFFTDDKVGKLSRDARLFFFGVLSEADDEGRLVDSPKRLAGVVFPFDDDVTPKKVERWINELVEQRMVVRYTHDGGRFLYVRKFKDHQKMSHPTPSTLPPPPPEPGQSSGVPPEKLRSDTGDPPADFAPVFEGVFERVSVSEGVPSGDRSSSSLDRVGDPPAEEENPGQEPDPEALVCRLVAQRRHDKRSEPIPEGIRRDRWLDTTAEEVRVSSAGNIGRMLAGGMHLDAVVDSFEPPERPVRLVSPYPAYEPAADEGPVTDEAERQARLAELRQGASA